MKRKVIIIGAGFGGLTAARALSSANVDVTIVDRTNHHLFQPLLYQVATAGLSAPEIASPIRAVLAGQKNARVVLGEVSRVDVAAKKVYLTTDDEGEREALSYDWLVAAAGAKASYFGHDEWEKYAPGLKSLDDAVELRTRILLAFESAERTTDLAERERLLTFAIIGGGRTGVELAGAIRELARYVLAEDFRNIRVDETRVVLVEAGSRILTMFTPELARKAVEQLQELGVEVRCDAKVVDIDASGVTLDGNEKIGARTVIWAAGVRATRLATELASGVGQETDRQGRVRVGVDCSLPGHPEIFAIGDMAFFEQDGKPRPGVSPVAMQQARYVAKLIEFEESPGSSDRKPFKYFDKGSMATIGRSRAVAAANGLELSGFLAWLGWLFVHIYYLIGFQNRVVVMFNWAWSYFSYKRGARVIRPRSVRRREGTGETAPASGIPTSGRGGSTVTP